MDRLPVEVIQAILMHTDIDEDLLQFGLVCRKFAAAVQDATFALEHIRSCFQLSRTGMETFTKLNKKVFLPGLDAADMIVWRHHQDQLHKLWEHLREPGHLPFAYKVALFVLASQVHQLSHVHFPAGTILRIVQSIGSAHPVNWENVFIFLATTGHLSVLEYIFSNHLNGISNTAIETAIEEAAPAGQTETLLLLLACPSSDLEPVSLNGALLEAVYVSELHCVEALLNDPLKRVTGSIIELALKQSVEVEDLPISVLLIQHGVSFECLDSIFSIAPKFVHQLLEQLGIDPSYVERVLLLESVYSLDSSALRQLLNEKKERVTIMINDRTPVRMALNLEKAGHVLLFLRVADQKRDHIVQEFLDQNETPAQFREYLLERQ